MVNPADPYNNKHWIASRLDFLSVHPLCVFCSLRNITQASQVVDHIIPHRGNMELFWDKNNWQALCKPCHAKDKQLIENGKSVEYIGEDGWPIVILSNKNQGGGMLN